MKVSQLEGALLDQWVASALGREYTPGWSPSSNRQHAGPLADEFILTTHAGPDEAVVLPSGCTYAGEETAAYERMRLHMLPILCRAIVRTAYGDTVPEILL